MNDTTWLVVPTLGNRMETLLPLIETCGVRKDHIVVVDTYEFPRDPRHPFIPGVNHLHLLEAHANPNIQQWWNAGIEFAENDGADIVIVVNDDVIAEEPLTALADALRAGGQTIAHPRTSVDRTGWCFALTLAHGIRPDERFRWYYGDDDLFNQAREPGGRGHGVLDVPLNVFHVDDKAELQPWQVPLVEQDRMAFLAKWVPNPVDNDLANLPGNFTVGATMCRDEEDKIEACVRSMLDVCDAVVVLDTGSVDSTVAKVTALLEAAGVPYAIMQDTWRGYDVSRTVLIHKACERAVAWEQSATDNGATAREPWVLMMDADMTVHDMTPNKDARWHIPANGDVGGVWCLVSGQMTRRAALLRATVDWRYVRVKHESLERRDGAKPSLAYLDSIRLVHHGEAGDARDPDEDLADMQRLQSAHPDEPEWGFYIAQNLKMRRPAEAVLAFAKAIAGHEGASQEEDPEWVWYSKLQVALLLDQEQPLLFCHAARPQRAEPLYAMAQWYRQHGDMPNALLSAQRAAAMPEPPDTYYVDVPLYRYRALAEYANCLAMCNLLTAAIEVVDRITRERSVPADDRYELRSWREMWVRMLAEQAAQSEPTSTPATTS